MKTNKKYFNARKECPLCENSNSEIFYEENFLSTNVLDFLSGYYKNRVPIEVLEGTDFNIHYCKKCDFYWHGNILNESMLEELYSIWISPEESKEKSRKSHTGKKFSTMVEAGGNGRFALNPLVAIRLFVICRNKEKLVEI